MSDRLVGVMYEHRLALADQPLEIKLGGRPRYAPYQNEGGGTNPTALARWADLAVGLVAEDDVFRAPAKELAFGGAMGLADHDLGLPAGQSHTIEWSVHPVPQGDYWDVINAVRRNWNANFTIPGPHAFVDWSNRQQADDYYRRWVASRGLSMVTPFDAMFDNGKATMGTAIPLAKAFCERTAAWMAQLHRAAPQVKALFYVHCSLCTEPGAPDKYADSRLLDPHGNQLTVAAGGPAGVTMAPMFISTLDAARGFREGQASATGSDGVWQDSEGGEGTPSLDRARGTAPRLRSGSERITRP